MSSASISRSLRCVGVGSVVIAFGSILVYAGSSRRVDLVSSEAVCVTVDEPVVEGVRATGTILLSQTLRTADAEGRSVRVLARWINVGRQGANERVIFKGTPLVSVGNREPVETGMRTSPGDNPVPGDENLPASCRLRIQPVEGRTWGSVTEPEQLEIKVVWEPK